MTDIHTYSMQLPSDRLNVAAVEPFVLSIPEARQLSRERFHDLLLALTEAVNNAIYHGNKNNPAKSVQIGFENLEKKITFTVSDEGQGFDYNGLPDPTDPKNIDKPNGRGVFLMKNLADNVEFSRNGQEVLLTFVLN